MNHYEIVFVVDPQLDTESTLFNKCLDTVKSIDGLTHRSEDIGVRKLAYPINDKNTGHYFLLNIECDPEKLKDVEALFCLLYTSPSPRDRTRSRMPSSA